jgi:mRNA interferase RelE/StbE
VHRLELTRDVLKFLYGLPPRQFKQVAATMLDLLRDPEPHDSRPLRCCAYRRVNIGEYRIVYALPEDMVRVLLIGRE